MAAEIDYNGRIFQGVSNTPNGEVSAETRLHYRQNGDIVWATIEGGGIRWGTLLAKIADDGSLDMRYQHINMEGELKTGTCFARPEKLDDGRIRLYEQWQWTSGDRSEGYSVIEQVRRSGKDS